MHSRFIDQVWSAATGSADDNDTVNGWVMIVDTSSTASAAARPGVGPSGR